jgi:hypothetical protein
VLLREHKARCQQRHKDLAAEWSEDTYLFASVRGDDLSVPYSSDAVSSRYKKLEQYVGLDAGYVTTTPGLRDELFYRNADTDSAVLTYDEATKGIGSATELGTIPLYGRLAGRARTHADGDGAMEQYDAFSCLQAGKLGLYNCATSASSRSSRTPICRLRTYVLAGAGHDINIELNAAAWYNEAAAWATSHVPPPG